MTHVIKETRPTYRYPGGTRRYLSSHSAYIAWAKSIIFSHCGCEPEVGFTCGIHTGYFTKLEWVCRCGSDKDPGVCVLCGEAPRLERVPDNSRYLLVRNRLARWLKWRDRHVKRIQDAR